jgi:hypothetical protein
MKTLMIVAISMWGTVAVAGFATAADGSCGECVVGPVELHVMPGSPRAFHDNFDADPAVSYTLVLEQTGVNSASALVELNGHRIVTFDRVISELGPQDLDVSLTAQNQITIIVNGSPGSGLLVSLLPTSSLPPSRQPCGSRMDFFSVYPFGNLDRVIGIFPLGNMSAGGHIIPSDHIYVHMVPDQEPGPGTVESLADFYSPGRLEIVAVDYLVPKNNYEVFLQPCRDVRVYHSHVHEFDPVIAQALNAGAWICPVELNGEYCAQRTSIVVTPGQRLGSIVDSGLDWGVIDQRRPPQPFANPARYDLSGFPVPESLAAIAPYIASESVHRYCPIDYLDPALQTAALWAKFGSWDGTVQRTAPPICGTHMQDLPGTAQGNWFRSATDGQWNEDDSALALVHDNIDPTVPRFSVSNVFCPGTPCLWSTGLRSFSPESSGEVNRDFGDVVPGAVYCYDSLLTLEQNPDPEVGIVLLEVYSSVAGGVADRLRIEPVPPIQASNCGSGPWFFSPAAVEFQR